MILNLNINIYSNIKYGLTHLKHGYDKISHSQVCFSVIFDNMGYN